VCAAAAGAGRPARHCGGEGEEWEGLCRLLGRGRVRGAAACGEEGEEGETEGHARYGEREEHRRCEGGRRGSELG